MSRARDWIDPRTGDTHWFDVTSTASLAQLELLAEVEDGDFEEIIDANLSQKEVHWRLNRISGKIPQVGLERLKRRERWKAEMSVKPPCRICSVEGWECEGRMTRHHYVPKWMMIELSDYLEFAPRSQCTIWLCAGIHRILHLRDGGPSKSIVKYLDEHEKQLAHHLVAAFREERPRVYKLIAGGDKNSYEWQLVHDWRRGSFDVAGIGKEPFPRWKFRDN